MAPPDDSGRPSLVDVAEDHVTNRPPPNVVGSGEPDPVEHDARRYLTIPVEQALTPGQLLQIAEVDGELVGVEPADFASDSELAAAIAGLTPGDIGAPVLTGNTADDVDAIAAGTGVRLPVASTTGADETKELAYNAASASTSWRRRRYLDVTDQVSSSAWGQGNDATILNAFLEDATNLGHDLYLPSSVAYDVGAKLYCRSATSGSTRGPRIIGDGDTTLDFGSAFNQILLTITGQVLATQALSADANAGDYTVTVASTPASLVAGAYVKIRSDELFPEQIDGAKYGEITVVEDVTSGTVTLRDPLLFDYATADTATLEVIEMVEGGGIEGIEIINSSLDVDSIKNLRWPVYRQYCAGFRDDLVFTDYEQRAHHARDCYDFDARLKGTTPVDDDTSSVYTYLADYAAASRFGRYRIDADGGRHAFTTTGTTAIGRGVPAQATIIGEARNMRSAAWDTHTMGHLIEFARIKALNVKGAGLHIRAPHTKVGRVIIEGCGGGDGIVLKQTAKHTSIQHAEVSDVAAGSWYDPASGNTGAATSGNGSALRIHGAASESGTGTGAHDSRIGKLVARNTESSAIRFYCAGAGTPVERVVIEDYDGLNIATAASAGSKYHIQTTGAALSTANRNTVRGGRFQGGDYAIYQPTAGVVRHVGEPTFVGLGVGPYNQPISTILDRGEKRNGIICASGWMGAVSGSLALTADRAYYVRFVPDRDMTVDEIAFVVTVAAGADDACDVGLYTSALAKIVTAGATTGKLNGTGRKTIALTATALKAGTVYYAGFSCGTLGGSAASIAPIGLGGASGFTGCTLIGSTAPDVEGFIQTASTPHPLPNTAVISATSAAALPLLALIEA